MASRLTALTVVTLLAGSECLKPPTPFSKLNRRAALAGFCALPAGMASKAHAGIAEPVEFKVRDYGNGANTQTGARQKAPECPEGQSYAPDGFGGKICRDKVKPVPARLFGGGDSPPPPPPPPKRAAAPAPSTRSSSSAPALSFDDSTCRRIEHVVLFNAPCFFGDVRSCVLRFLRTTTVLANSIKQKEEFLGREMTAFEKDEMKAKLASLLGK